SANPRNVSPDRGMITAGWSGPESGPDTREVESRPSGGGGSGGGGTGRRPRLGGGGGAGRVGGVRGGGGWAGPRCVADAAVEAGRRGGGTGMVGVGGTGSPGRTGDATADTLWVWPGRS